ncbi:Glutathione gamma-glutamylcysteinyltransferase 1 [Platanthera zijinensis]|uniref:Glutathione gamma-glutamylcysteinyltransferase 1 n=1 Tax=Platanthera zijinensis TaxID=2320716 RepID=A0AAP0G4Z1_9ASPA
MLASCRSKKARQNTGVATDSSTLRRCEGVSREWVSQGLFGKRVKIDLPRHESWVSTAKYLSEDLPILLKSESLHSVTDVLSLILESLPTNAEDFIKWMAEVRLQEEERDISFLSEEEKSRLVAKEGLLQQVQETKLFYFVRESLSWCSNPQSFSGKVSLSEITASVCCQGEELLNGGYKENKYFCCQPTCVRRLNQNAQTHKTTVSGTVISGDTERRYDVLVPQSLLTTSSSSKSRSYCSSSDNCFGMHHPGSNDVYTILLLALPAETWIGIRDENLLAEIFDLVSTEKLPDVLQEEVGHI